MNGDFNKMTDREILVKVATDMEWVKEAVEANYNTGIEHDERLRDAEIQISNLETVHDTEGANVAVAIAIIAVVISGVTAFVGFVI